MRLPLNEAEAKVNTRPFYQGTDQRWSQGQTTLVGVGRLSLGGGKGCHRNEMEQLWKKRETRATCRRKEMGGSLSSRPPALFSAGEFGYSDPGSFHPPLSLLPVYSYIFLTNPYLRCFLCRGFPHPPANKRLKRGRIKVPPSVFKYLGVLIFHLQVQHTWGDILL